MSSRREEKERLRAERMAAEAQEQSAARRRLIAGYFVAGLLAAAVVVGLVVVLINSGGGDGNADAPGEAHIDAASGTFEGLEPDSREGTTPPEIQFGDLEQSARMAGCQLNLDLADEGNQHVPDSEPVKYQTTPPTSGNHNQTPLADGAYTTPIGSDTSTSPNIRNAVHSMEHGRVMIQYDPDLPEDQQLALKGVFDEDPAGMLMFPNPDMPFQVAATAWTDLVGCPRYDPLVLDVIRNFRDTVRGTAPEPVPL